MIVLSDPISTTPGKQPLPLPLMAGDIADVGVWSREMARALAADGHLVDSDFHPSWAQRGWSRTFRSADGGLHEVSFASHSIAGHVSALEQADLRVRTIREPRGSAQRGEAEPGLEAFGRRSASAQVVVVFRALNKP